MSKSDVIEQIFDWISEWYGIFVLFGIVTVSSMIGAEVGKANSPEYGSAEAAHQFMLAHAKNEFDSVSRKTTVTLEAGKYIYKYKYPDDKITRLRRATDIRGFTPPRRWKLIEAKRIGELLGLSSLVSGGLLQRVKDARVVSSPRSGGGGLSGMSKLKFYAVMAAGAATGGIIGYWWTYDDEMDYENEKFVEGLSNKSVWKFLAKNYHYCKFIETIGNNQNLDMNIRGVVTDIRKKNKENCKNLEEYIEESL